MPAAPALHRLRIDQRRLFRPFVAITPAMVILAGPEAKGVEMIEPASAGD